MLAILGFGLLQHSTLTLSACTQTQYRENEKKTPLYAYLFVKFTIQIVFLRVQAPYTRVSVITRVLTFARRIWITFLKNMKYLCTKQKFNI